MEKDRKVEGKQWLPAKWDYEADVVVVGYGTAGAAAAITAHDAGAEVLVLEKQRADTATFIDHTPSVRMAASSVLSPTSVADAAKHLELLLSREHSQGCLSGLGGGDVSEQGLA